MEPMTREQKNKLLFVSLVEQFRLQAWISLGKIKNPVTDKIERNLEMAKTAIDMLRMIQDKTDGNLAEEEKRMLKQAISDLQLNYVDEYEKEQREKAAQKQEETPAEARADSGEAIQSRPAEEKTEAGKEQEGPGGQGDAASSEKKGTSESESKKA